MKRRTFLHSVIGFIVAPYLPFEPSIDAPQGWPKYIRKIVAKLRLDNARFFHAIDNNMECPKKETTPTEKRILRQWLDTEWPKIAFSCRKGGKRK